MFRPVDYLPLSCRYRYVHQLYLAVGVVTVVQLVDQLVPSWTTQLTS